MIKFDHKKKSTTSDDGYYYRYSILNDNKEVGTVFIVMDKGEEPSAGIVFRRGVSDIEKIYHIENLLYLSDNHLLDITEPYDSIDYDMSHLDLDISLEEIRAYNNNFYNKDGATNGKHNNI